MEDALAQVKEQVVDQLKRVLILVVMEDALAPDGVYSHSFKTFGLNPCCNGRCTRTRVFFLI